MNVHLRLADRARRRDNLCGESSGLTWLSAFPYASGAFPYLTGKDPPGGDARGESLAVHRGAQRRFGRFADESARFKGYPLVIIPIFRDSMF